MTLRSITYLSEETGFDRRTIKKRLESIAPVKGPKGAHLYETKQVLEKLYVTDFVGEDVELINGMEPLDYERWRKTKAEATAQELKNEVTRKELAPVRLIEFALANIAEQISSIFDSIPLKIKKRSPKLNAGDIEKISKEIIKAQNVSSRVQINWDQLEEIN